MDAAQLQQFEQIVQALLSGDNNIRSQAEAAYNAAKANLDALVSGLIYLLRRQESEEQIRSMSALLLRKAVMQTSSEPGQSLVTQLSAPVATALKQQLLECIQVEPQRAIRKKVCDAVGQLGINVLSADMQAWPELLPFMLSATKSGNANMHEAALTIFNALSEFMCHKSRVSYHAVLLDVFQTSLQPDQPMLVRTAALKAIASFLLALEDSNSRTAFANLVPLMLRAISDALQQGDEAEVRSALEVFVEVAESQPKFLKKNIVDCVSGMIAISSNTDLEDATRHLALEFLLTIAENAPAQAKKIGTFCQQVVPVALGMMLEIECDTPEELQEWEEQEEDEEDTEITNYDVGEEALDRLAIAMGGKVMVPVLFEHIQKLMKSQDWKQRHASLMAISQSGEGCEKQMAQNLEQILQMIVAMFSDPHPRVRWAAINTVGQMCTDFGPDLQRRHHALVLPTLIRTMDDGCKRVQAHAAAAVINFCEHCSRSTLQIYLSDLLGKLMQLLQRNVRRVVEQAVTAIASVADVAESDFVPFYASFMPGLKGILQQGQAKEYRMLRGKAMECISLIGVAVGKEVFAQDAKEVMDLIIATQAASDAAQLDSDDPQISFMLQACGRICKCLGEQFQPYLPYVIPPLLRSAQIDPELRVLDHDDDDDEEEEEEGVESVTVALRGGGHKRITIRTSALEEKATACTMLSTYAQELKEAFFPYVESVAQVLIPLIKFQYLDDVRTASMSAMPELLGATTSALKNGVQGASPEIVMRLKDVMVVPILEQLASEPDVEALAQLLDSWNELIELGKECPPARLNAEQLTKGLETCKKIISESMARREERQQQEDPDEDDEDEAADEEEQEEILVQNVVESVGKYLEVYTSAEVLPIFDQLLLPLFSTMFQPARPASDKVAALCVFDDIVEHCSADGGADHYVATLLPAYLQYASAEEVGVRQAAVYGLGVLAEHSRTADEATLQQAAAKLLEVVDHPLAFGEDNATASDNAVSALGKVCRRSEAIATHVLPRWLSKLPLGADKEEARSVHKALVEMVEATNLALMGANHERLPEIICVFGQLLDTELLEDDVAPRVGNILRQIRQGLPQVLQALPSHPRFAKLSPEQRSTLERAISS